ncbi:hypothetical protein CTAYLR_003656 [Chrysophaeum taylorii]|uniref:Cyclic nucleotide-binding domain-containing protein n=1 Tax=Chrysophaeum taylorii TaxID=2483200 RepID=A0AAD7XL29_9STRA|nr:hypothetical protein CTAYLR_003656 [Chrysophaeum taylorii]
MMAPDDLRAIMSLNLKSVDMDNSAELGTNPQPSIPCLLILTFVQDVFFVIDIGLNFFTAVEVDGEIVSNQRRIAVEYLRSWFLIDAGAVIGFPLVFLDKNTSNSDAVKLIKLLKLVRIVRVLKLLKLLKFMRLNRVISRLEFSFILRQHVLQILSFAVGVLLTCHVFACVFYAIGARNRRDGEFRRSSWISRNELDRASKLDRYIAAFYWVCSTVTTVGYGDIHAVATLERTWSIVVMIIGASIFAVGTSWAIHLCEQLQWRKRQFSTQIQSLNMFMDQHKIPDHLRAEVREDLISRHSKYALSVAEEHRLMENLSLDLRSKLSLELNVNYLKKIKFMHCANPEVIRGLAAKLHTAYFSAGDVIVHEGDIGDCMFFIVRGAVEVLVILDGTTTTKRVAMLSKNQFFGEGAVVGESQRRNATVRSIMFTEVRTLSRATAAFKTGGLAN